MATFKNVVVSTSMEDIEVPDEGILLRELAGFDPTETVTINGVKADPKDRIMPGDVVISTTPLSNGLLA